MAGARTSAGRPIPANSRGVQSRKSEAIRSRKSRRTLAAPSKFEGYKTARYQVHDANIVEFVDNFNLHKAWIGATPDQVTGIPDLSYDLVKAWLIQESGGSDNASLAAWSVDPAQVNVPGDWNEYKLSIGLQKPDRVNTGDIRTNLKAAIGYLARKGFGKSGQPPSNNPQSVFDDWTTALQRYNGRSDGTPPYRERYAKRISDRASDPKTYFPIELGDQSQTAHRRMAREDQISFEYLIDSISSKKAVGRLVWDDKEYAAVSGPYGAGYIELGDYTVKVRDVATGPGMDNAYCLAGSDGKDVCFFIPLDPDFTTERTGIGIHPDGNVPGTEGCVGLQKPDFEKFWKKWLATPIKDRPTSLTARKVSALLEVNTSCQIGEAANALSSAFEQRMEDISQFLVSAQKVDKFFPNGVSKISVTIKLGGDEISVEMSGPDVLPP